jgi:Fic family protein
MDIYGYNMDMISQQLKNKIRRLKAEIDELRPLNKAKVKLLEENLLIEWIYNSNAIEGNSLSLGETAFFLRQGLTSEGKPLKDFLEATNHQEAIFAMQDLIRSKRSLSQSFIKELHAVLLKGIEYTLARGINGQLVKKKVEAGKYKTKPNHVLTLSGQIHFYTEPIKVQDEMDSLMQWYSKSSKGLSVVELAAVFHYRLVKIHPFDDGNGRLARILMNLLLIKEGFLPAVIKNEQRKKYLLALETADKGDLGVFVRFVTSQVIATMESALAVLRGEKISELEKRVTTLTAKGREEMVLTLMKKSEQYSLADILQLVSIKRPTLKSDLSKLVQQNKLKRVGKGKGTRYLL